MAEHRPPVSSQAQLERMLFDAYGGKPASWHRQVNDWFGGVVPHRRNIERIANVLGVPPGQITPTAARPPDLETQMEELRLRQEAIATSLGDGLEEAKQMLEDRLAAIESRLQAAGI